MIHMKIKCHFTAYKTAAMMLNFIGQLSIGRNTERGGYFLSVPSSAFELDRPETSCAHVFTIQNTGFLSRADDTLCTFS